MQSIDVVIPTRNRLGKLLGALSSIPPEAMGCPIRVVVVCDGDRGTFSFLEAASGPHVTIHLVNEHKGAVYCRNLAIRESADAVLYATDDIIFNEGAIATAAATMRERFPDDDGVIGFAQTGNGKYNPAGVALVGRAFLLRYPNKDLFFPGYFHFACQEIHRAAVNLNRFIFCESASLTHLHPSFNHTFKDVTHVEARQQRANDKALSNMRDAAGLTWGTNTEAAK